MNRNSPLTERQRDVVEAIRALSKVGRGPTYAEIGERVGIRSTWAVRRHLDHLEQKGFIKPRTYRKARSVTLAEPIAAAA
jgi:SOS-response transcriptional repressor LexA